MDKRDYKTVLQLRSHFLAVSSDLVTQLMLRRSLIQDRIGEAKYRGNQEERDSRSRKGRERERKVIESKR